MSKVVAVIQARLGSERFPRKVLAQLPPESGISMLELVVRKALLATSLDDVVVVTPDRFISVLCNRWGIEAFMPTWRERNVIREFYNVVMAEGDIIPRSLVIVRLTADCPLISPQEIDRCVGAFFDSDVDILYNTDESTGQLDGEGADCEVFWDTALAMAYQQARTQEEKEHPTLWMRRNLRRKFLPPVRMGIKSVNTPKDYEDVVKLMRGR